MPITPFHVGPGLLLKGLAPRHVSLTAFVAANVVIDAEVVVNLLAGRSRLHAELHTLGGAVAAGLVAGWAVAAVGRRYVGASAETDLRPALLGGLAGGLGQTLLDALMHADLRPFWPVAGANPWLGTVDLGVLHSACLAAGAAGLVVLGVRQWRRA